MYGWVFERFRMRFRAAMSAHSARSRVQFLFLHAESFYDTVVQSGICRQHFLYVLCMGTAYIATCPCCRMLDMVSFHTVSACHYL